MRAAPWALPPPARARRWLDPIPRDLSMVEARTGRDERAANRSDRPPIRLAIVGNSQAVMCSPTGGPRSDRTYAQWLRRLPTRGGTTIEVVNASYEVADVRQGTRIWRAISRDRAPDVLLVHLGTPEAFSSATPHWLWHLFLGSERHAGAHHRAFERVRPRLWLLLRSYQRAVDRRMGPRGGRVAPPDFERGVRALIGEARARGTRLVLLAEVTPLERIARNTPSAPARLARMQAALAHLVEDLADPDVQLVPIRALVDAAGGVAAVLPDGYHFAPELHRQIAETVREAVSSWEDRWRGTGPGDGPRQVEEREPPLRIGVIAARDLAPLDGRDREGSYPAALHERELDGCGRPEVFTVSRPDADVRLAIDAFQPAVQQVTPDVVVIDAGAGRGRLSADRLRRELQIAIQLARRVSSPLVLVIEDPTDEPRGARRGDRRAGSRDGSWAVASAVRSFATEDVRSIRVPAPPAPPHPAARERRGRLPASVHEALAGLIAEEVRGWRARCSPSARSPASSP